LPYAHSIPERIQKILARAGLGSRRACEELIRDGRVTLNGVVAQLGQKADLARDSLEVDGRPVSLTAPEMLCVAVYKPVGVLSTTRDDRGRSTVRDLVPLPGRLNLVGRLDRWSEGLVLLTNDGDLTNHLTHPRYGHTKEYHVCLEGRVGEQALERWRRGILLDGKPTAPARASLIRYDDGQTWIRVVLREGRKRQIRRVAAVLGHPVRRLVRVRVGPVHLGDLEPGDWRRLTKDELGQLRGQARRRRS
jgi:pseudouridine synthase